MRPEPEDGGGGDDDGGHEGVGAAVVASMDAPPILEAPEHTFAMALTVEGAVVCDGRLAGDLRQDAGGDPLLGERVAEPGGVVAAVRSLEEPTLYQKTSGTGHPQKYWALL